MVHRCPGNCLLQQAFIEFQSCTSVCYRVLYINVRVGYCIISPTAAFGQESIDSTATLPSAEACLYRWQYIHNIYMFFCFVQVDGAMGTCFCHLFFFLSTWDDKSLSAIVVKANAEQMVQSRADGAGHFQSISFSHDS